MLPYVQYVLTDKCNILLKKRLGSKNLIQIGIAGLFTVEMYEEYNVLHNVKRIFCIFMFVQFFSSYTVHTHAM